MRALVTTTAILSAVALLYGAAYLIGYQEHISASGQPFGSAKAFKVCPDCDHQDHDIFRENCQRCGHAFFDASTDKTDERRTRVSGLFAHP